MKRNTVCRYGGKLSSNRKRALCAAVAQGYGLKVAKARQFIVGKNALSAMNKRLRKDFKRWVASFEFSGHWEVFIDLAARNATEGTVCLYVRQSTRCFTNVAGNLDSYGFAFRMEFPQASSPDDVPQMVTKFSLHSNRVKSSMDQLDKARDSYDPMILGAACAHALNPQFPLIEEQGTGIQLVTTDNVGSTAHVGTSSRANWTIPCGVDELIEGYLHMTDVCLKTSCLRAIQEGLQNTPSADGRFCFTSKLGTHGFTVDYAVQTQNFNQFTYKFDSLPMVFPPTLESGFNGELNWLPPLMVGPVTLSTDRFTRRVTPELLKLAKHLDYSASTVLTKLDFLLDELAQEYSDFTFGMGT